MSVRIGKENLPSEYVTTDSPMYSEWTIGPLNSATCSPIFMQFTGSSGFLLGRKWNWLAEIMAKTWVIRHARIHQLQMNGPTVHSYTVLTGLLQSELCERKEEVCGVQREGRYMSRQKEGCDTKEQVCKEREGICQDGRRGVIGKVWKRSMKEGVCRNRDKMCQEKRAGVKKEQEGVSGGVWKEDWRL